MKISQHCTTHPVLLAGALCNLDPTPMSAEEARALLAHGTYFDYVKGRVLKVDLSGDEVETWLYDRDNGEGAAEKALLF